MKKTVFISSTYQDLAEHRRAVWQVLEEFDVSVKGMEQFGARTEAPLQTCLAEVEQSDVYVGIVAFRMGTLDSPSGKSFTQIEYEHALQTKKEILVYLADEQLAKVRYSDIEVDPVQRERLSAFKTALRENHTVDTFSTPEDLAEKLRRDFARYFEPLKPDVEEPKGEYDKTLTTVRRFLLLPKSAAGREVRLRVSFPDKPYPASRTLCKAFNLEYGMTIGSPILIKEPNSREMRKFGEIYATGIRTDRLLAVMSHDGPTDFFARLQFAEDDVPSVRARFFNETVTHYDEPESDDPNEEYFLAEGKVILLFSKTVS